MFWGESFFDGFASAPGPNCIPTPVRALARVQREKDIQHKMPSALEGAHKSTPSADRVSRHASDALLTQVQAWLDEAKAEQVVTIDIRGKSSIGDYMLIASGRSDRHVGAIAEQVQHKLKDEGYTSRIEGQPQCDWVLIDMGDIIVHVFRPEVREFYNLEKMWSAERPSEPVTH